MLRVIFLIIAIIGNFYIFMLEKGATIKNLNFKTALNHSLIFSFVSSIMMILGYEAGSLLLSAGIVSIKAHHFITIIALLGISAIILITTMKRVDVVEQLNEDFSYRTSLRQAFCSCIDIFLMGVSLSTLGVSISILTLLTFFITLFAVLLVIYIGYYNGAAYQRVIGILSSLVYFVIAIYQLYVYFLI